MRKQNIPHYNFSKIFGFTEPKEPLRMPETSMAFLYYNGWTMADLAKSELGVYWKKSKQLDAGLPVPPVGWYAVNLEVDLCRSWSEQINWASKFSIRPLPAIITASIVTYQIAFGLGDPSGDFYSFNTADTDEDSMIYQIVPIHGQKWRLVLSCGDQDPRTGMAFGKFLS